VWHDECLWIVNVLKEYLLLILLKCCAAMVPMVGDVTTETKVFILLSLNNASDTVPVLLNKVRKVSNLVLSKTFC
jgi:hypothetical protein